MSFQFLFLLGCDWTTQESSQKFGICELRYNVEPSLKNWLSFNLKVQYNVEITVHRHANAHSSFLSGI